jgi:hypothetical protein
MKSKLLWLLLAISTAAIALPLLPWISNEGAMGFVCRYMRFLCQ